MASYVKAHRYRAITTHRISPSLPGLNNSFWPIFNLQALKIFADRPLCSEIVNLSTNFKCYACAHRTCLPLVSIQSGFYMGVVKV